MFVKAECVVELPKGSPSKQHKYKDKKYQEGAGSNPEERGKRELFKFLNPALFVQNRMDQAGCRIKEIKKDSKWIGQNETGKCDSAENKISGRMPVRADQQREGQHGETKSHGVVGHDGNVKRGKQEIDQAHKKADPSLVLQTQEAHEGYAQLESHIEDAQEQDKPFIGTGDEPEEKIEGINRNQRHDINLPGLHQISVSTVKPVKAGGIIHFIIVIDAVEGSPDKHSADQNHKSYINIVEILGRFHG